MKRMVLLAVAIGVMALAPGAALAQSDAKAAFAAGKEAYAANNFEKAREQFLAASQTDQQNPETFLWLGRSCYQLGLLDEAVAAWQTTLKLAPNEAYATKMLAALRGQSGQGDVALAVVQTMLHEEQFDAALARADRLLADKAITDTQRLKAMMLRAEALLGLGRPKEVGPAVGEIIARYPKQIDMPMANSLVGRAYLRTGGELAAEGLAMLKKVIAENAGTQAAILADHDLATSEVVVRTPAERAAAMVKWIAANPDHPLANNMRRGLIEVYLASAVQASPVGDPALGADEVAALGVAGDLIKRAARPEEADIAVARLVKHLDDRYGKRQAYTAPIAAMDTLLKSPLSRTARLAALRTSARFKIEAAVKQLAATLTAAGPEGAASRPANADMPAALAAALAACQTINTEYPAEPAWREQAMLADRVRGLATLATWPAAPTEAKAPLAWALQIDLPVVKADADPAAVDQAIKAISAIVDETAGLRDPAARGIAPAVNGQLLAVLNPESPAWTNLMWRQVDLLDAAAAAQFKENSRLGRSADNAKLTPAQQQIIATLQKLVARQGALEPRAIERLAAHLQLWVAQGQAKVAEEAYTQLSSTFSDTQKRDTRLAVVKLNASQAIHEHDRLLAAGLTPARAVDPVLAKAMADLYDLERDLKDADPAMAQIRVVWDGIVNHYKRLEYYDVAEQAIRATIEKAAPSDAYAYAQFQLCTMKDEAAGRDLQQVLKSRDGAQKLPLTAAYKAAIEAYQKFITDQPTSPQATLAVNEVYRIGGIFEQHKSYDVAAGIYRDFAAFAEKQKVLSEAAPGTASTADSFAFAAASVMEAKARAAMAKMQAERKPDTLPPAKISDDFAAAIAAYRDFIKNKPQSPYISAAIQKSMGVALEYARIDSWTVADGIYADLLNAGLPIRNPERLELCRALAQLGQAMPDHAREVLGALTNPPVPAATSPVSPPRSGGGRGGAGGGMAGPPSTRPPTDGDWGDGPVAEAAPKPVVTGSGTTSSLDPGVSGKLLDDMKSDLDKYTEDRSAARRDEVALATIRQQETSRAAQVAMLREKYTYAAVGNEPDMQMAHRPVISDAELARQQAVLDAAYTLFTNIRKKYAATPTAEQARGEIMVMVTHWRGLAQWDRAATLARKFLADNPTDFQVPQIRLQVARDYLSWAAQGADKRMGRQAMLAQVAGRFDTARKELMSIVTDFPDEKELRQQAQWDVANSFLAQARVVDAFSPTLSRGQYVRAARELQRVAREFHDHPAIASIPQMLWQIAAELQGRQYFDEAIMVWSDLINFDPTGTFAAQAATQIASTYRTHLNRPLRAVETYLEINYARGGADVNCQNAIFQIGSSLRSEKRWVEALRVLETFVDSFPRHANAGEALAMIGQIHQTNEAWNDAIAAYKRVITEFDGGDWAQQAKWSIADCTINLSKWREAAEAYDAYVTAYPKDAKVAEATRRISVLKDLQRYQTLVDEPGQRKAYQAQFDIATVVRSQLANPQKAIIEFSKVAENFPKSHLATEALFAVGQIYLEIGDVEKARESLLALYTRYPDSSYADDAMVLVGKSYEDEAVKLAGLTRGSTEVLAKEVAQKKAYQELTRGREALRLQQNTSNAGLRASGKNEEAEFEIARQAVGNSNWDQAQVQVAADKAAQDVETLTAVQLADRQDKISAALRRAVEAYASAAKVPGADKAGEALLRMAVIYDEQLKDTKAALDTWVEIVRQFSGTAVAEEASWRTAQYYERAAKWDDAIEAYKSFLRNYRSSARAAGAQFAVAEGYEHLNKWVAAMDAYQNYISNFPSGPMVQKAREQINWIKLYRAE